MIKVTPKTRLPLKTFVNKGTYQQRLEYAQNLNAKFFKIIRTKMSKDSVSLSDYYRTLKDLIPNINFNIAEYIRKGFLDGTKAQTVINIDKHERATKFTLEIPYTFCEYIKSGKSNFDKRIHMDDFYLAMHENFHLLASVSNPKHLTRQDFNSQLEADIYKYTMYSDIPSKFGFKEKREWKKNLKENIQPMTISEKINFLQNCRYRLLEENLAWNESKKYTTLKEVNVEHFHFEEKIKIIEKLLYKLIK